MLTFDFKMKKLAIITGSTNGIGKATAKALINKDYEVLLIARNAAKASAVKQELTKGKNPDLCRIKLADLADLRSVQMLADEIKREYDKIDVLINNAGGVFEQRQESKDGLEMHFALNHMAHFVLTTELESLLKSSKSRIINVSSEAHRVAKPDLNDLAVKQNYSPMRIYGNVKLYNIWFTKEIVRRWGNSGVTSYALHPGVVRTGFAMNADKGMWKSVFQLFSPLMINPDKGAETSVYCATEAGIEANSGKYFKKKKPNRPSLLAQNEALASELWSISETLKKEKLG